MFVSHLLIKPNTLHSREYQDRILQSAVKNNTLVCLPTGLGKTAIAITLAASRLEIFPDSKILVCAPTRPLANQHYRSFLKFMNMEEGSFQVITGTIKPEMRKELYKSRKMIFATPQTIKNDTENGVLNLADFSLLVLDEVHHAIGNYAYPFVSKKYYEQAKNPRILGLTASPGGTKEKISEICKNIGVEAVEIRTEKDEDVIPYIKEKEIEWVYVDFPESFKQIRSHLSFVYEKQANNLKRLGFLKKKGIRKRDLLSLQKHLITSIGHGYKKAYTAVSVVTQMIKVEHAIGLLETQGISSLERYFKKLQKEDSKTAKKLLGNMDVSNAMFLANELFSNGATHPKMGRLCSIVSEHLKENRTSKIIIFANYRGTVSEIVGVLGGIENARPVEFIGQRGGITQKEQVKRIEDFKLGIYNILVCTSVGEEGIDIPEMELAIFYEAVPSEIRNIQRRGRVGRTSFGKIIILLTKGTRDEAYYWASRKKETKMRKILMDVKKSWA
jgi:Fanconi anemia group M protein